VLLSPWKPVHGGRLTGTRTLPNLDVRIGEIVDGLEIVAMRRLGDRDDAHDAVQETVARLLERVRAGAIATEEEIAPVAWGIVRHVIADILRARQRRTEGRDDVPSGAPGPLDALVSADEAMKVRVALAQLSADDRTLLCRCFVDGERIGRIAAELGEPAERLRKRKSRALQRLAAIITQSGARRGHETAAAPVEQA